MKKYTDPDPYKNKIMQFEDKTMSILGLPFKEWQVQSTSAVIGIPPSLVYEDVNYTDFGKKIARALISIIIASNNYPQVFSDLINISTDVSWKNFIDEIVPVEHEKNCLNEIQDCTLQNTIFPLVRIHVTDTRPGWIEPEKLYMETDKIFYQIKNCTILVSPMLKGTIEYSFMEVLDNLRIVIHPPYKRNTNTFKNPYVKWIIKEAFEDFSWIPSSTKLSAVIDENIIKDTKLSKFMSMMFHNNIVSLILTPALNPYTNMTRLASYYLGQFYLWDGIYDWNTLRQKYVPVDRVAPADVIYFDHHELDELFFF